MASPAKRAYLAIGALDTSPHVGHPDSVDEPAALTSNLRERTRLLTARIMFREATGDELVRLACDLLVAGIDTPSIVALAGLPYSVTMTDAEPIFGDALVELGLPPLPRDAAGWVLAGEVARKMIADSIPQNVGAAILWGLWWEVGQPPEIAEFVQLLDEWEVALPPAKASIEDEMRANATAVIAASDRAASGNG